IKDVARVDGVATAQLPVNSVEEIKVVGGSAQETRDSAKLNVVAGGPESGVINFNRKKSSLAVGIIGVQRDGRWNRFAAGNRKRPKFAPGLQGGAARKAAGQRGQARGRRGKAVSMEVGDGGENLFIKSAE